MTNTQNHERRMKLWETHWDSIDGIHHNEFKPLKWEEFKRVAFRTSDTDQVILARASRIAIRKFRKESKI